MPTPILQLLSKSNSQRQLAACQLWNWSTGVFYGFLDRSHYLKHVSAHLLAAKYPGYPSKYFSKTSESEDLGRAHQSLKSLQEILQSNSIRKRVTNYFYALEPLANSDFAAQRELAAAWNSPQRQAALSVAAIRQSLRERGCDVDAIARSSRLLNVSSHCYPPEPVYLGEAREAIDQDCPISPDWSDYGRLSSASTCADSVDLSEKVSR